MPVYFELALGEHEKNFRYVIDFRYYIIMPDCCSLKLFSINFGESENREKKVFIDSWMKSPEVNAKKNVELKKNEN